MVSHVSHFGRIRVLTLSKRRRLDDVVEFVSCRIRATCTSIQELATDLRFERPGLAFWVLWVL